MLIDSWSGFIAVGSIVVCIDGWRLISERGYVLGLWVCSGG